MYIRTVKLSKCCATFVEVMCILYGFSQTWGVINAYDLLVMRMEWC